MGNNPIQNKSNKFGGNNSRSRSENSGLLFAVLPSQKSRNKRQISENGQLGKNYLYFIFKIQDIMIKKYYLETTLNKHKYIGKGII